MKSAFIEYFGAFDATAEVPRGWEKFTDHWKSLKVEEAIDILHRIQNGKETRGFRAFEALDAHRIQRWGAQLIDHRGALRFAYTDLALIPFQVASAQAALLDLFSKTAVREGLVTIEALLSQDWLRCFAFDSLIRDREESLFSHQLGTYTAHRIALSVLIKIEATETWLDGQLSDEAIGQAIVYALIHGKLDLAKKLLTSRMIKPHWPTRDQLEELTGQALLTLAEHVKKRTKNLIKIWNDSVSDPEFVVQPSGNLEVLAIKTLAALGRFRDLPVAALHDQIDRNRQPKDALDITAPQITSISDFANALNKSTRNSTDMNDRLAVAEVVREIDKSLSARQRTVFRLRTVGFSLDDVAEKLGVAKRTVQRDIDEIDMVKERVRREAGLKF